MDESTTSEVLVVGGGPAGVIAAITVARQGHEVVLIDKKKHEAIGAKICGDVLSCEYVSFLHEKLGIEIPSGEEREAHVKELVFHVEDMAVAIPDDAFIIDRHLYGQRLLLEAEKSGVTIISETEALELLITNNTVNGVLARNKKTATEYEIRARVTIDCSGSRTRLRCNHSETFPLLDTTVEEQEFAVAYREIITIEETNSLQQKTMNIFYARDAALPAYFWIFPKGSKKMNVGFGQLMKSGNAVRDTRRLFTKKLHEHYPPGTYEVVSGRGDFLSARYPVINAVANGFLIAGDAAFHASPFSGEGHGPALAAGYHAGMSASKALQSNDPTEITLWDYNMAVMKHFGKLHVSDQLLADFMREMGVERLKFLMKRGIFYDALVAESPGILLLLKAMIRMFPRYDLLVSLLKFARTVYTLEKLLDNYPRTPEGYEAWKRSFDRRMKTCSLPRI